MQDIIYPQAHMASLIIILILDYPVGRDSSVRCHAPRETWNGHLKIHVCRWHLCISLHVILSHTHVLPLLCWPKSIWGKRFCNPILLSQPLQHDIGEDWSRKVFLDSASDLPFDLQCCVVNSVVPQVFLTFSAINRVSSLSLYLNRWQGGIFCCCPQ